MGILKAIGFSDGHVFGLLIGEALAISLLGAVAGVGLAWLLANVLHYNPKPDFLPVFYLPGPSMLAAAGLAATTGFLSGIVPAAAGMRLKATEALRSV
jgi:putative ABC transport system permease protein